MDIASVNPRIDLPRPAKPAVQERLLQVARELAAERPLADVTLSEVARRAHVSWPTARRYLGSKENLHALLQRENLDQVPREPGTRELLLAAAARVFARSGYSGATLDEVGAEAGMTKGAVYWHFATKAELFLALAGEYTLVVVEHDMDFVAKIADRVTVLHEGHVLAEGSMKNVQENEQVIEVFLGR